MLFNDKLNEIIGGWNGDDVSAAVVVAVVVVVVGRIFYS